MRMTLDIFDVLSHEYELGKEDTFAQPFGSEIDLEYYILWGSV